MTAAKTLQIEPEAEPLGVYVHFPWCLAKCPYCDFLSIAADRPEIPHRRYADAVISELERRAETLRGRTLRSVFFGGGTPSLWEPAELGRVLGAIRQTFAGDEVEITAECNPTSFDRDRGRALAAVGVNRVSLGVQGLNRERLEFLGRLHDVEGGLRAVRDAVATEGLRVSADLIFGVAGQSPEEAVHEALAIAELGVTHLSAYALTIEAGTAFGALAKKGKLPLCPEDVVAESFLALDASLGGAGFSHYEISNYAKDGHVAVHNLGYWRGHDYLGLGCGAWGTVSRVRYRNTPSIDRYLAEPGALESEREPIDAETALRERILLGLRLDDGLDLASAARELGVEPWNPARRRAADRLIARGRLQRRDDHLRIPKNAWLHADGTIAELL
jgi:oxygen-independent coproporphyrinogen-3 oxidase